MEKVNPDNPREYKTPQGWRPFTVEEMQIAVKGEGVRKVERRRTRHGPVLPGFYRDLETLLGPNHVAALQWTALSDDDTTIVAGMFDPNLGRGRHIERIASSSCRCRVRVLADSSGRIGNRALPRAGSTRQQVTTARRFRGVLLEGSLAETCRA